MDAGVLERPTWNLFRREFGRDKIASKSSLCKYTEETHPYIGGYYQEMIQGFRAIVGE